jgi:hypothetical protein
MAINANMPVAGANPGLFQPNQRDGAHTLNVIGGITPLKMVPDMMNRAAYSAVRGSQDAALAFRAGAQGLNGLRPTFGASLMQALNPMNLFRSLKFGALVSFPIALIQNFIDMKGGKINQNQMLAGTVADGIGYTVAGSIGTIIGGLVGSIVPFGGTLVGMLVGGGVGILLSEVYDKMFKPDFRKTMEVKMFGAATGGTPVATPGAPAYAPVPVSPTPPAYAPAPVFR